MPTKSRPFEKKKGEKPHLKSYRFYAVQDQRVKKLSKRLSTKDNEVSESEIVRMAIDEMYSFHFNK